MTELETVSVERENAFTHLTGLIRAWTEAGKKTTTAGVTSALKNDGVLDLQRLRFATNAEFWEAAESAGIVRRTRLVTGHWYLTLPNAPLPNEHLGENTDTAATIHDVSTRLRNDVWAAFVDWSETYRRFWDNAEKRAFFVPSGGGWVPATIPSGRFTEISPPTMKQQVDWMRDFARLQDPPASAALTDALSEHAARGAFRRELQTAGLQSSWRQYLRRQVLLAVGNWAEGAGIDPSDLLETMTPPPPKRATVPSVHRPSTLPNAQGHLSSSPASPNAGRLRAQIHQVVDAMSEEELRALPLRGAHLLAL